MKCPLEITADDYFVTSNGLRCNPSYGLWLIYAFHAYQVHHFCLIASFYLSVCFVHVSVSASAQLEKHSPENTNKITDVQALTCTTFHLLLLYIMEKYACFYMAVVILIGRPIHGIARQMGASN